MKLKYMTVPVTDFKYDQATGEFECYANTKNNIDNAKDRPLDGCYKKSISRHKTNGTMPKMLWSHDPSGLPVGPWKSMSEDSVGLKMQGKLSKTTMGRDIEILAKDNALDSFSIGYIEVESRWNSKDDCNDLIELDIKEVSWVNFACDENAQLQSMKSAIDDGGLPTKRELQKLLQSNGLSKSQASKVADNYNPKSEDIFELMAKSG